MALCSQITALVCRVDCCLVLQRMEMPVASSTEPAIVAGALAARVRDNVDVYLSAIGVDAVGNAMRAICYARIYLEVRLQGTTALYLLQVAQSLQSNMGAYLLQDNGLDIKAMPEFMHLSKDGVSMSGLVFNIIVESAV